MKTPNGIESWLETYFEIACVMGAKLGSNKPLPEMMEYTQIQLGHMGHQQRCTELTDIFELKYKEQNWEEKDWFETIDEFIQENL